MIGASAINYAPVRDTYPLPMYNNQVPEIKQISEILYNTLNMQIFNIWIGNFFNKCGKFHKLCP